MIEAWRRDYNTIRPHSPLRYQPTAPTILQRPAPQLEPGTPANERLELNANLDIHNHWIASLGQVKTRAKSLISKSAQLSIRRQQYSSPKERKDDAY